MRIVVLGYLVRGPVGGMAWHHLQYVLGLARLGHEVCFVEDSDDYPSCYDPSRHVVDKDPSYGLRFAADAFKRIGLDDQWAYFDAHRSEWRGPGGIATEDFCRSADVVLNVSGVNPLRDWTANAPVRAFIDTDPVFTQVRNITDDSARKRTLDHNSFFTFAENVRSGSARIPDDGIAWRATRQPVVLDIWKVRPAAPQGPYTTVMQWQSYPPVEYEGKRYGTKADSFPEFIELPRRVKVKLEVALGGSDTPREMLRQCGWQIRNPLEAARSPQDFMNYVTQSRGEIAVAKQAYVVSNSGWFSERSAGYLASGRPVVTQQTGFSEWLPTGNGLIGFTNLEEAATALEMIENDYPTHASQARAIAEQHFDSSTVLSALLKEVSGD